MTGPAATWQQANDAYLAAAVAWLHLRLERLAGTVSGGPGAGGPGGPGDPGDRQRAMAKPSRGRPAARAAKSVRAANAARAAHAASEATTARQLAAAARAMNAAAACDPPPALELLARRFGLSDFERSVLLLCAAMELDTRTAALCARAQDDPSRPYPTFALAFCLFDDPAWEALSPARPLLHWRLVEVRRAAAPLIASPLAADDQVVNHLKGLVHLDERLAPLLLPLAAGGIEEGGDAHGDGREDGGGAGAALSPSQQEVVDAILGRLQRAERGRRLPVIVLAGRDSASKQAVAARAAAALEARLYRLPAALLPAQAGELDVLARLLDREAVLSPLAVYLDARELERPAAVEGPPAVLGRFLDRCRGLCFLDVRDVVPDLCAGAACTFAFDVGKPSPAEQQAAWEAALGGAAPGSPPRLAGQFSLGLPAIRRIAREAREALDGGAAGSAAAGEQELHRRLWGASLAACRPRLDALAQRLELKATWDDIVLPPAQTALLRQIATQVEQRARVHTAWGFAARRSRGLGIAALFTGESGTGKTMAAEVIANALRLDLYRIDLSAVMSKYIGETEKNLCRLFDAAEDGGAVLFFDEADALFGKRSEVKDSHDRYANVEIDYLLQRMEAYHGLAILATNLRHALDPAFVRRLRFIIELHPQTEAERREIWRRIFPPATPTRGLDGGRLARLNFKGGDIANVAIHAAFLAAAAGSPVTMELVLAAARTEAEKLKLPVNADDFAWREPVLHEAAEAMP